MQVNISKSNCVILSISLAIILIFLLLVARLYHKYSLLKTRVVAIRNSASVETAAWEEL
nr:putative 6kDa protein [Fig virus B]